MLSIIWTKLSLMLSDTDMENSEMDSEAGEDCAVAETQYSVVNPCTIAMHACMQFMICKWSSIMSTVWKCSMGIIHISTSLMNVGVLDVDKTRAESGEEIEITNWVHCLPFFYLHLGSEKNDTKTGLLNFQSFVNSMPSLINLSVLPTFLLPSSRFRRKWYKNRLIQFTINIFIWKL